MLSIGAKSLQEEVDRWRALINTLPALVALWDRDQRNVMGNAAYEEWFGLPPAELRGMHLREVLGAGLYAQNLPHVEAALRGERQTFDRTVVTASGETRHTQATYVPHVTDDGVQGFYAMVTDVTPKVEAQRDLLATQALARIGSYTVAPATQTLQLSPELRRMLGFDPDGPGPSLDEYLDLVHPDDRARVEVLRELAVRGEEYEGSYRLVRPDGEVRHVHSRTSHVLGPGGEVLVLRGVMQDVTEVRELTDELAATNRLLTDLIAMLGHDLGQPVAVVNGYLEHLVEEWDLVDPAEALLLLRRAVRAGRRVDTLLGDILSIITVESSQLTTRPRSVDVAEVVRSAADHVAFRFDLTSSTTRSALVDPVHLERVVDNLLVNAGRYGAAPYAVEVGEDGEQVVLTVRDHGAGVPEAFVPRLFDRFARAHPDGGVTGTGLGLYLVRELARANGGDVVHRRPDDGPGAVFEVRLPMAGPSVGPGAVPGCEPGRSRVRRRPRPVVGTTPQEDPTMSSGHTPPKGVQEAAQRAVRWIDDGKAGKNFTDVGDHRARQLAGGEDLSDEEVRKMQAYFKRHAVDKDAEGFTQGGDGFPSPGRVAWDAWGGDPGERWVGGIDLDD